MQLRRCSCQPRSTSSQRPHRAPPASAVSLKRLPDASAGQQTVVERRAADVAILGSSTTALLAAYSLAKAGRKVLLLPDFGVRARAGRAAGSTLQPLRLTSGDPLLAHAAAESAAYWRGLELLASAPLLARQGSLDVCLDPDRDHPGAEAFSRLQEASASAGVAASRLSGAEACAVFRPLRLPASSACLLQPDGGVINAADAAGAARVLAGGVGVLLRDGLTLRGWRDRGSCFQLRACSALAPDLVSLFEAELLLLAPGAAQWPAQAMALFGLQLEGLQAREVLQVSLPCGDELAALPLLQAWGAWAAADDPQAPQGVGVLPLLPGVSGGLGLQQLPAAGRAVADPFSWQPVAWQGGAAGGSGEPAGEQQPAADAGSSWVARQVRQLHASCAQLVRGVAPLEAASASSRVRACLPDGRPLLAPHPGFDQGRVTLALGASCSAAFAPGSCASGYQLTPLLAKLAADAVRGAGACFGSGEAGPADAVLAGLGLRDRAGLSADGSAATTAGDASWDLRALQQAPAAADAFAAERAADEGRDAEREARGAAV